ncbi:MAG: exodeoxyribonuclease VII large subunit [Bacilli bacterium]|nr:exodeoxyribonuclease VII large subunit [Bacilli bacterium]
MEKNNYITVTQLNKYIKYKIDNDPNLGIVFLKGEISNFKNHTRGHLYFTIKDETSRINAVMFKTQADKIKFDVYDGMKVLIRGRISVYEASGSYQIYVEDMLEDGLGSLYVAFEKLKEKLSKEGLFLESHKKRIPKIPKKIGIITAPTGAALKDILSTIKRRWPLVETILFPSLVQGELAKNDIVKNIKLASNYDLDVLIVGRGGGSIEDLWPFNEEIVARAIYESDIPIISAVGHEIDFTIADFVADKRAPTPTGAAEMAVPNIDDIKNYLEQVNIRLYKAITTIVNFQKEKLLSIKDNQIFKNPYRMYEIKEQMFDILYEKLLNNMNTYIDNKKNKFELLKSSFIFKNPQVLVVDKVYLYNDLIKKLTNNIDKIILLKNNTYLNLLNKVEVLNPITTIKRGYSITKLNDKTVDSIKKVKKGDKIITNLVDGVLESEVIDIHGC